jgi:hypothetical protein
MKLIQINFTIVFVAFVFSTTISLSQTLLPSIISSNITITKANSPYLVTGSTLIEDNVEVIIEAGVVINIDGALNIRGMIQAMGTTEDSIFFNCNNELAPGLRIVKGFSDTLNHYINFSFCNIKSESQGIYSFNRKISIDNSKITNCKLDGIWIENGALRIDSSIISHNLGKGIYTISDNAIQIAADSCFISNSIISYNDNVGIDWKLVGTNSPEYYLNYHLSISKCEISNNKFEGIKLYGNGHNTYIEDNEFIGNSAFALSLGINGGGKPNTFVMRNLIAENKGAFGVNIPHFSLIKENIIVSNKVNTINTSGNTSGKPELLDFKWSNFFYNNTVAFNEFENLISTSLYNSSDSLRIQNNLFFNNTPINSNTSFLYLDPSGYNPSLQWSGYKFDNNNYFIDKTSNYWIKNEYKILDFIAKSNYVSSSKPNFDGLNGFYGFVYEVNPLSEPSTNAPISPVSFYIDSIGNNRNIVWSLNPERDLGGYKVYLNKIDDYHFNNYIDVGLTLEYSVPIQFNLSQITVTAYDNIADGVNDQYEGHESWYSKPSQIPRVVVRNGSSNRILAPLAICPNETFTLKATGVCDNYLWNNGAITSSITIDTLKSTYSFFYDCLNNIPQEHIFVSPSIKVNIDSNPLELTGHLPRDLNQNYNSQEIISTSKYESNSKVDYIGSKSVTLGSGFFFNGDGVFNASIGTCPN